MSLSRGEALTSARKLLRTFASAPDPRRQAQAIYSQLAHADGWPPADRSQIDALGVWLADSPRQADLKTRCEQVVAKLK